MDLNVRNDRLPRQKLDKPQTMAASVTLALNEMNKFSFEYSSGLQQLEYVRFWREESGRELVLISHEVSAGDNFPYLQLCFQHHTLVTLYCRVD